MSSDTIKMTKEFVDEQLKKMDTIIAVAETDLKAFENINDRVLTEGNCAASKRIKKLKDTNEEAFNKRKKCIEDAVENLKIARTKLQEYAEEIALN